MQELQKYLVVAINKIDKEGASPDRVKQELSEKDLIAEDWGGYSNGSSKCYQKTKH